MIEIVGTVAIVIACVVIGVLIDRKVRLLPTHDDLRAIDAPVPEVHAAGTAPDSAIAIGEVAAHVRARRCGCKRKGPVERDGADEPIRFDGAELIVVPLVCRACGARHRCYARV